MPSLSRRSDARIEASRARAPEDPTGTSGRAILTVMTPIGRDGALERERGLAFDSHAEGDRYPREQFDPDVLIVMGTGVW
jgi:hypothetical protein